MAEQKKYRLRCTECGAVITDFKAWFEHGQSCPECHCKQAEIEYTADYAKLPELFKGKPESFWHYFDFLPLMDKENIVSCGEGAIPLERWKFLEQFANDNGISDCKIYVYRNDLNGGTNTFKDIAASMAASIFKENGVKRYCIASTGNTATAYGKYLAMAGISAAIFMPDNAVPSSIAEIASYGQKVYHVSGDYSDAKAVAAAYAQKYGIPTSAGNIDPIRVESKRTMVFEWLRMLGKMPDVYVQAVSGGTGPLALDKAYRELEPHMPGLTYPRPILIQTDKCDPMVQGWEKAVKNGFPEGFEKDYPVIKNPQTMVSILGTGNPGTYPKIARIMKQRNGNFLRVKEDCLADVARIVAFERKTHVGPASAVCIAGLMKAVMQHEIKNGQTVLVNMGEGIKRAPWFLDMLGHHISEVRSVEECHVPELGETREELWKALDKNI